MDLITLRGKIRIKILYNPLTLKDFAICTTRQFTMKWEVKPDFITALRRRYAPLDFTKERKACDRLTVDDL